MSNTMMKLVDFHSKTLNLGKNDVILDVRRPDEFAAGHIKGALNIPVDVVAQRISDLQKYEHVYIHCKRGGRAQTAYSQLQSLGLTNLVCIFDEGMDHWLERGFPVEKN